VLVGERLLQPVPDLVPRALVLGLLLAPDDLLRVRIPRNRARVLLDRERIELLDPHDRDAIELLRAARLDELVVDLAAAEHDAPHALRIDLLDFADQRLETSSRKLLERRNGQPVTEQALRRHHDQRLPYWPQHLTTEQMEHLRRRRRHADLHVVLGTELQEALEARGRVLRPLPFMAVRKEEREAA